MQVAECNRFSEWIPVFVLTNYNTQFHHLRKSTDILLVKYYSNTRKSSLVKVKH